MSTANFAEQRSLFEESEAKKEQERKIWQDEFEKRRHDAHVDMLDAISNGANFDEVEDICLSHGCDLDEIENVLHGF